MAAARVSRSALAVFLVILLASNGRTAEEVGSFGDLKQLEIRGCVAFTADDIKDQLWQSLDIQMAAYPKAPLSDYIAMLDGKICEGYRYAGFPDVKVTGSPDQKAGRLVLTIVEGERLRAGDIRVEGANAIPVTDLVRALTSRRPKKATQEEQKLKPQSDVSKKTPKAPETYPPVWEQGKPAHLDQQTKKEREAGIRDALADLGFTSTRFIDDVSPDPKGGTASLVIRIHDEGVQTVLDRIDILGNERNSRQEIIDYLELKPGMPLNRQLCDRLRERLWMSGRFIKADVSLMPVFRHQQKQGMAIDVLEYPKVPRLSEPLSPIEKSLMKWGRRMSDQTTWPGDLVCHDTVHNVDLVMSPDHGTLLLFHGQAKSGKAPSLSYAFAATSEEVGVYNAAAGRKCAFALNGTQFRVQVGFMLSDKREDWDRSHPFITRIGLGITTDENTALTPFRLDFTMTPSGCLAMAHEHKATCSIKNDVLSIDSSMLKMKVENSSGQLMECKVCADDESQPPVILIGFEKGTYDRYAKELRAAVAGHPNSYDPHHSLTSAGKFLATDETFWNWLVMLYKAAETLKGGSGGAAPVKLDPQALSIARKLLAAGILSPLDALCNTKNDADSKFQLRGDCSFAQSGVTGLAAQTALYATDSIFPRDSWPWTLTREISLMAVGRSNHSLDHLSDLYGSAESGPVCCLAAGSMAFWIEPNGGPKMFGKKGLKRLDVKNFRNDYRFLLQPNHPIAKHVNDVVAALRTLDDDDIAYLLKKVSPERARILKAGFETLRQHPDKTAVDLLPQVLDAAWEAGLRETVKTGLESLTRGSPPWQKDKLAETDSPTKR